MPATAPAPVVGGDDKIISIPPSASALDDGEYYVSPLHKRNSTEMWAHALANITPTPSAPSTSTIFPTPSLIKQDSSMSASTMVCSCGICQDAIGNHNAETSCDTAARMLRIANRSFVGEAIKFITTVALAFLIGYYALKSQMSELKGQVSDLRTQVDAAETQFATANRDLTDQVSKARTDIQAQVAASTTGLDSRLSIYINILRAFPDAATINATIKRVENLDVTRLSQQVHVIQKDVQILANDTLKLHSNITNWTEYLDQTQSMNNQHLNNVTSQYMDVSQQLQQAIVNTSQHYDRTIMMLDSAASSHLHSLNELRDNTMQTLQESADDVNLLIHDTATNISLQFQRINQTIINDMMRQYDNTIQLVNAATTTVRTAIDDAQNNINQIVINARAQLEQSINNTIVLRNMSDNVTLLINDGIQHISQLHTHLSSQLQQLQDVSIATMSDTWSQFNRSANISRTQLYQSTLFSQTQLQRIVTNASNALNGAVTDASNTLNETVTQASATLNAAVTEASATLNAKAIEASNTVNAAAIEASNTVDGKVNTAKDTLDGKVTTASATLDEKVTNASNTLIAKATIAERKLAVDLKKHSLVAEHHGVAAVCSKLLTDINSGGNSIFTVRVDQNRQNDCNYYCGLRSCIGAVAQTTDPLAAAVMSPNIFMRTNDPLTLASSWSSVSSSSSCVTPIMSLWSGLHQVSTSTGPQHWGGRFCYESKRFTLFTIPNAFNPDTMIGTIEIKYTFTKYCRCQEGLCTGECNADNLYSTLMLYSPSNVAVKLFAYWNADAIPTSTQTTRSDADTQFQPGQLVVLDLTGISPTAWGDDPKAACFDQVQTRVTFTYQQKTQKSPQHQRYCCCTETAA